jgi:hypothetical protein
VQSCSHSASTEAYQKIRDVQDENAVKKILCATLTIIETDCREDLEDCFSDDDIVMMTVSHMKEMKKFLVRIARGKVDGEALEHCDYNTSVTPQVHNYEKKEKKYWSMGKDENPNDDPIHDELLKIEREKIEENKKEAKEIKSEQTILFQPKSAYEAEMENKAGSKHISFLILIATLTMLQRIN